MALLGVQLVVTLIMISIIQKLGKHLSFAKWLLCSTGLIRYLYPTNDELRQLANIPKDKSKGKKGSKALQNKKNVSDTFHIEKSLDVHLGTAKVTYLDVIHLRYYTEYQWLVDFSMYAAVVYVITEVYQMWFPIKDEVNLSMIWCFLVILFAIKLLLTLTLQYFKSEESVGERSTCIVMGFIYLLIAMMILIVDEGTLELGLESAYTSFNQSASAFLSKQGLGSSGPASKIFIKFCIAVWCALLGTLLTFPGIRIAKMHWDLLRYFREDRLKQLVLNITFALPFLLVILWIKPVTKDYLTVRIFTGRTEPLMTEESFEIARLITIITTIFIKLSLMPWYLQAYLDMAYHRIEEQKKEAGRITNIEFQKKVAAVFYYLCVVSLQYLAPLIICLYLSFLYKTLSEYKWSWLLDNSNSAECYANKKSLIDADPIGLFQETDLNASTDDLNLTLDSLKTIFATNVFKGVLGFATWWNCFVYFAATSVGLIYQSYFSVA